LAIAAYLGCWVAITAILSRWLLGFVWQFLRLSAATGLPEAVTWLVLPLGAAVGIAIALATRQRRLLHAVLIVVGLLLPWAGSPAARQWASDAEIWLRAEGPLSGLVPALVNLLTAGAAVVGLLVLGAGLAGGLADVLELRRASPGATQDAS
jgi:hypothetical protein